MWPCVKQGLGSQLGKVWPLIQASILVWRPCIMIEFTCALLIVILWNLRVFHVKLIILTDYMTEEIMFFLQAFIHAYFMFINADIWTWFVLSDNLNSCVCKGIVNFPLPLVYLNIKCLNRASIWPVSIITNSCTPSSIFIKNTLKVHVKFTPTCFGSQMEPSSGGQQLILAKVYSLLPYS